MPITVKQVKGHEYLYFSYYDRDDRRKREVYMGPKDSFRALHKALQFTKEFLDLEQSLINKKYKNLDTVIKSLGNRSDPNKPRIPQ